MENTQKSAFGYGLHSADGIIQVNEKGLTKREYFAGLAMQSADMEAYANKYGSSWAYEVAKDSVLMADVLLAELDRINKP
jgi:hypothetical protein